MRSAESQQDVNRFHLLHPEPGDYWDDMFAPVCVVLAVDDSSVTVCQQTQTTDRWHWTWNLHITTTMTLREFADWLSYKSEAMRNKTWADVSPGAHKWTLAEWPGRAI